MAPGIGQSLTSPQSYVVVFIASRKATPAFHYPQPPNSGRMPHTYPHPYGLSHLRPLHMLFPLPRMPFLSASGKPPQLSLTAADEGRFFADLVHGWALGT